mmetsp:Transcript_83335/g.193636  ORF Transcript_83335/g.193636 Transcript_83335/m.193636 type:complete len:208 (+) Transcript_83335:384-1007(+)
MGMIIGKDMDHIAALRPLSEPEHVSHLELELSHSATRVKAAVCVAPAAPVWLTPEDHLAPLSTSLILEVPPEDASPLKGRDGLAVKMEVPANSPVPMVVGKNMNVESRAFVDKRKDFGENARLKSKSCQLAVEIHYAVSVHKLQPQRLVKACMLKDLLLQVRYCAAARQPHLNHRLARQLRHSNPQRRFRFSSQISLNRWLHCLAQE